MNGLSFIVIYYPYAYGWNNSKSLCILGHVNHPSVYGGYIGIPRSVSGKRELSLRIWRVPATRRDAIWKHRIIPPHTEGTQSQRISRKRPQNHPSPYGGYELMDVIATKHGESSLRIWRVLAFWSLRPRVSRIIPPYMEGTFLSSASWCPG